jgi:NADH-quinone oxidoreductase subunit G
MAKKMLTLTIDDQKVSAPEGMLIVDAAKTIGIDVPVFCYHPKMEPVGMCRMCLVDIGRPAIDRATGQPVLEADGTPKIAFGPKLETACTTPISEGMVVVGLSDKVKTARKEVIEFLLTSHPLDCPVCDKGGECPLQNLTMGFGPGNSRFQFDEKIHFKKQIPLGELIMLDRERCIQCARCIRYQDEIVADPVIGFYKRGRKLEIVTYSEPGFDSYFSGNTTDICPVGALTTSDFRFGARPWEMKTAASICTLCPVGCNTSVNTRREAKSNGRIVIKRIMPRQNEQVNELWICDKGRIVYKYAESGQRLTAPLVRKGGELVEATWDEALNAAAAGLKKAGDVTVLAGGRISNEDLYVLSKVSVEPQNNILYTAMGGGDLVARYGLGQGSNFSDMGKGTVILVVDSDLHEEAPIWWLRVKQASERGATVIQIHARKNRLNRYADFNLQAGYGDIAKTLAGFLPAAALKADSDEAKAAQAVKDAENLVIIFGAEGQTLSGSQELAATAAEILAGKGLVGKVNSGLIGVWPNGNTQGAWELGYRPADDLKEKLAGAQALVIAGADPAGDDPHLAAALSDAKFMVVQELFLTETAKMADVVFPAASVMEREGTWTSGERRVQRAYPTVTPLYDVKPDYRITGMLAEKLGLMVESRAAALIFAAIATEKPAFAGLSYLALAETSDQWPIIGRKDVYYGGTGYDNNQGLGRTLLPAGEEAERKAAAPQTFATNPAEGLLTLVPFTRLYDHGAMMVDTPLLQKRKAGTVLTLNPKTADLFKIKEGYTVEAGIGKGWYQLIVKLDEEAPEGLGLVPASTGLPLTAPLQVNLRAAEQINKP